MDFSGLLWKYKVYRPLTEQERADQLRQKERLETEAVIHQLTLVRINSTYLETVDKYYVWRGYACVVLIAMALFTGWLFFTFGLALVAPELVGMESGAESIEGKQAALFMSAMFLPFFLLSTYGLFKEIFCYRYYPLRFNRKTRMVYVFRMNGTVLSVPWDEVFFTLNSSGDRLSRKWNVRGHVLDKDGATVKESFALGMWDDRRDALKCYWEYIRRYMEDDSWEEFISSLDGRDDDGRGEDFCLPIIFRRETWWFGFRRHLYFWSVRATASLQLSSVIFSPIAFVISLGRVLAMRTSKQPRWPAEIEAQCAIEPNDPYERDARHNIRPLWGLKVEKDAVPL